MLMIDSLAYASGFRTIHPGKKVLATVLLLILAVTLQRVTVGAVLTAGLGILSVRGGKTPIRLYVRLLKIPLLFIAMSLIAIAVNVTLEPPGAGSVSLGPVFLSVTGEGALRGARLAASAMGAVSALYFLALSTPLTDIFYVLEKGKCPFLIIELMLLIYRFVFLLWSIAGALGKAADSRLANVNFKTAINTLGQLLTTLFILALKRSSAIYDAMESRGYDGRINVLPGFQIENRNDGDYDE